MVFPTLAAFTVVATFVFLVRKWHRTTRRLPPGPKTLPFVGNAFDVPTSEPWLGYRDMCEQYGDIVFLKVLTQPVLVLGSAEAVTDLLEKRSHIYSDRHQVLTMKLLGWDFSIGWMSYGPKWRAHRRAFHQYFNQNEIAAYRSAQIDEIRTSLYRLLDSPQNANRHIRHLFVSTIFRIVYGRKIQSLDDQYVMLAEKVGEGANIAGSLGQHWVDYFPALRHVPSWLPGGRTRRLVERYRPALETMLGQPVQEVKEAMACGAASPSVVNAMLTEVRERCGSLPPEEERMIRNVAGVAYFGGADTSTSAGSTFLLAMAMFPHVQRRAQEELDRIVGPDRLPDFDDLESLVYVQAIALEVLRWIPAGPLSMPHRLTEDDEYRGYFIPKGTIIIPNTWAMLRDPRDYLEPDVFMPERFLKDGKIDTGVRDPNTLAYGYGRRMCPGRFLANTTLSLLVASVLHVFDISPGLDDNGCAVVLSTEVNDGTTCHPLTIPRGFTPRSESAERLVCENHPASCS